MLWLINFVSSMVGWSMGIALSVHIFQLTHSPLWTAVMAATPTLSGLLFGHLGGVLADRWDRLRVVQASLSVRVAILGGLFLVAESPVGIAALVFAQAAVQQVYRPAEQVLIADFVSREDLLEANSLNSIASNATRLIAPALGGSVIAFVGFAWTALGMTAFMVCSALLSLTLGKWDAPKRCIQVASTEDSTFEVDSTRGTLLGLMWGNRRIRGLVLFQAFNAVKEGPLSALFPVLMLGVVGASSTEMGIANSAFAASAVIAGPIIGLVTNRLGFQLSIVGGAAVANTLSILMVIWPSFPMALVIFFLSGLPFTVSWVGGQTWLLASTPKRMRGRVVGTSGSISSGVTLFTMLGSGALAETFGAQWVMGFGLVVSIVGLVAVSILLRSSDSPCEQ